LSDRISVIINTKDRREYLGITLSSLLGQTFQNWDLTLLDASSEPVINDERISRLLTIFRKYGHQVLYETDRSLGIPHTYQRGLEISRNNLLIRMEDDVWMEPEMIERAYEVINSNEKVGAVGFMTPNWQFHQRQPPPKILRNGFVMRSSNLVPNLGLIHEPIDQQELVISEDIIWDVCTIHAGSLFRRSAAERVGGFATHFSPTGHREETLFYCRLWFTGWELKVRSTSRLWHFESSIGGSRPEGAHSQNRQNNRRSDESKFQGELRALIASYPDKVPLVFDEAATNF